MSEPIPDRLILREGKLCLRDGGNTQAYLKEWSIKANVAREDSVMIVRRDVLVQLLNDSEMLRNLAA